MITYLEIILIAKGLLITRYNYYDHSNPNTESSDNYHVIVVYVVWLTKKELVLVYYWVCTLEGEH